MASQEKLCMQEARTEEDGEGCLQLVWWEWSGLWWDVQSSGSLPAPRPALPGPSVLSAPYAFPEEHSRSCEVTSHHRCLSLPGLHLGNKQRSDMFGYVQYLPLFQLKLNTEHQMVGPPTFSDFFLFLRLSLTEDATAGSDSSLQCVPYLLEDPMVRKMY